MKKIITPGQTEQRVYNTINSMASYFGINSLSNDWFLPRLPKVSLVEKYPSPFSWAGYNFQRNELIIQKGYEDKPHTISHEVGHWWHKMLNPDLFRIFFRLEYLENVYKSRSCLIYLAETVALYSEALFSNIKGLKKIDMHGLTLSELVKMDCAAVLLRREEFEELSTDLHKLCDRFRK